MHYRTWSAPLLSTLLLSVGACSAALAWSPVTELTPPELADFVHQHDLVAVQFTTPDKECIHCVGADEAFDAAAALNTDPDMVFARVQWPVYRDWPSFRPLFPMLFGVPAQMLFVHGSVHRRAVGKPASPELMLTQFEDMAKQPPGFARDDKSYGAKPAQQPLTQAGKQRVALHFRRGYVNGVVGFCGTRFPDQLDAYRAAVQAWEARRRQDMDEARRVMAYHSSPEDYATKKEVYASEFKAMGALEAALQVGKRREATAAGCARVIDAIADLP